MPTKVLIVGAGPAGLAAAYSLASQPNASSLYDITVLVKGERLGGKCSGGRDTSKSGGPVYEHGFHVMMSCYKTALPLLRDCYDRLGLNLADALTGVYRLDLAEVVDGKWETWPIQVAPVEQDPQVLWGSPERHHDEIEVLLQRIGRIMQTQDPEGVREALAGYDLDHLNIDSLRDKDWKGFAFIALLLARRAPFRKPDYERAAILIARFQLKHWASYVDGPRTNEKRHEAILVNLLGAIFRGVRATPRKLDGTPNYDAMDEYDLRTWLLGYGATSEATESAVVQAGYSFVFSGRADGNGNGFAAGTAVRGLIRIMCTNGPLFYSLNGSAPAVLIVPLYKALRTLNVKFDFFTYVKDIVAEDGRVSRVDVWRQVGLKAGTYTPPLSRASEGPAWREEMDFLPDYSQIVNGDELRDLGYDFQSPLSGWTSWSGCRAESLSRTQHFDVAILAADPSTWPSTCPSLVASNARLSEAMNHLATTATQSAQLWTSVKVESDAQWPRAGGVLANNPPEFDTWADVTSALRWDDAERPKSLVYLCGRLDAPIPMTEAENQLAQKQVATSATQWVKRNLKDVWPTGAAAGSALFVATHAQANVGPSDRYVESRPGTTRYRPGTTDTGLKNLLLAGDWTKTDLQAGCFESAVASGVAAANCVRATMIDSLGRIDTNRYALTNSNATAAANRIRSLRKETEMRDYVEMSGAPDWRGPFHYEDVDLHQFFVKSPSVDVLQRWVDRYLNFDDTSPVRYQALGNFVILQFTRAARGTTLAGTYARRGYTTPVDAAVSILVTKFNTETNTAESLRFVNCWIWVDSAMEMAIGREAYGLLKLPGEFEVDWDKRNYTPSELEVSTPIVDRQGDRVKMAPVLRVVRTSAAPTDELSPFPDLLAQMVIKLGQESTGIRINRQLLSESLLVDLYPSMVGMRQLRDSKNASLACFQEVTEPKITVPVEGARGAILSAGYAAHFLANHESMRLPEILGFEENAVVEVAMATYISMDSYTIE